MNGFIDRYYDWGDFERFVKDLYEAEGDVVVEHNVTEKDKYGAPRQVDVKITRTTRFHTYVTLVECKRWKDRVTRAEIDILGASVDALGAQKGAIFTTSGYEEGALIYANGRNIDVFVVRELTDEEWGSPGRRVEFYMHLWAGQYGQMQLPNASVTQLAPGTIGNLDIRLDKDHVSDPQYDLYSIKDGSVSSNLNRLLADAHGLILKGLSDGVGLLDNGADNFSVAVKCSGHFDFANCDYKQMRIPVGLLRFERIVFEFAARINQTHFKFDRGAKLDFALVVENYLNSQRHVAHRTEGSSTINFNWQQPTAAVDPKDVLQNGSIFKVILSPWVALDAAPTSRTGVVNKPLVIEVVQQTGSLVLQMK